MKVIHSWLQNASTAVPSALALFGCYAASGAIVPKSPSVRTAKTFSGTRLGKISAIVPKKGDLEPGAIEQVVGEVNNGANAP
jgi:hypothetical protein